MRQRVVRIMRPYDAVSVENRAYPGTADVNYVEGWVELKWMPRWPRGCEIDPVRVKHFTPQQRVWLRRRWRRGGNVYLLLQAGQDWLLFAGDVAADLLGKVPRPVLVENALAHWKGLNEQELKTWLTGIWRSSPRVSD
jgi:hypothetical protein